MKRAATLVLVMLAMSASAAVDARALASEGQKTQWAPTRNFSSLNARAVFAGESRRATSPYAGEAAKTAAAAKEAGFTGHRTESALGLVSAEQRWLDPLTGTWMSRDPVGAASYLQSPNELNPWQYAAGNPTRFVDADGRQVNSEARDEARYQSCERMTPGQCGGGSGARDFLSGSADAVCATVDGVVGAPERFLGVVGNARGIDVFRQECVSRERRDGARAALFFAGYSALTEKAESVSQSGMIGLLAPSRSASQRFVGETTQQWVEGARAWSVGDYYTAGNRLTPAAVKTGMFVVPAARATRALAGPALEAATLSAYLRVAPVSVLSAEESAVLAFSRGVPTASGTSYAGTLWTPSHQPSMSWWRAAEAAQTNRPRVPGIPTPIPIHVNVDESGAIWVENPATGNSAPGIAGQYNAETRDLYIHMIEVPVAMRGQGLSTALYQRLLDVVEAEYGPVEIVSGRMLMSNNDALVGGVENMPRAHSLRALGYSVTTYDPVTRIAVSRRPQCIAPSFLVCGPPQ